MLLGSVLLWGLGKLPWPALLVLCAVGLTLLTVWMMIRVHISNNQPLESIGSLLSDNSNSLLSTPAIHRDAIQDASSEPEIEFVTIEMRDRRFQANNEPFTIILARYYFRNSNAKSKLDVRGHVFFSRNSKPIKQVFYASWNDSSRTHKQFKTGDAHDLVVGVITGGGYKLVAFEFGDPNPILTPLAMPLSNNFQVRIDLIGTGDDGRIARSTTRFIITLRKGLRPKIENIVHSIGQTASQPSDQNADSTPSS